MLHIESLVLYGGLVGSQRDMDSLKANSSVMPVHHSHPIEHLDLHRGSADHNDAWKASTINSFLLQVHQQ